MSRYRHILLECIVFACILLFVYAALGKLMDIGRFKIQIGQAYYLKSMAGTLAWVIPGAELSTAALLAVRKTREWGYYCFLGLMVVFTVYIIWAYYFSASTPCSCGGVLEMLGWQEHLFFNLGFIALAAGGLWFLKKTKTTAYYHQKKGGL